MAPKPIISIVIPAYNRVKFLETTVSLFVAQIMGGHLADQVEIVIGNDASPDGTGDYINRLQASHKFVKAVNHPKNLGLYKNLEASIMAASGEYIWLFGEDDLIVAGAVKRVLEAIQANNPNYLVINTQNIHTLDDCNRSYEIVSGRRLDIPEDVLIRNFSEEIGRLSKIKDWLYLTNLLSAIAFKKRLFLDWIGEAKKRASEQSVYLHQAPVIMGIAKLGRLALIADPLVLHRKNENHWSKSIQGLMKINLYDSSEISDIIRDYMPSEYAGYQKRFAVTSFWAILAAKKRGEKINRYIVDALKKNYNCFPYNLRFLAVLLIPSFLLKLLK